MRGESRGCVVRVASRVELVTGRQVIYLRRAESNGFVIGATQRVAVVDNTSMDPNSEVTKNLTLLRAQPCMSRSRRPTIMPCTGGCDGGAPCERMRK